MHIYFLYNYMATPAGGALVIAKTINVLKSICSSSIMYSSDIDAKMNWLSDYDCTANTQPYDLSVIKEDDIVVLHPRHNHLIKLLNPKIRKIIFCQSLDYHNTVELLNGLKTVYHNDYNVTDIIFVSKQNEVYMSPYLPSHMHTHRLHLCVDEEIFHFQQKKYLQIAYMPKKSRNKISDIISRIDFNKIPVIEIHHLKQPIAAQILRESLMFLSWSDKNEGFFLAPAEAMACGCLVIGNVPPASTEFMLPDLCYPVKTTNQAVLMINYIAELYSNDKQQCLDMGLAASSFICENYNRNIFMNDTINIWSDILNRG